MAHPFVYVQLHTQQPEVAKDFYKSLFMWTYEESPAGAPPYTEIIVGDGAAGGIMKGGENVPSHWLPFVGVDDIAVATERARTLGARIVVEPTHLPGKGTYSVILDPAGAALALWQAEA